ncbi:MAG TPA: glycoside hydrolase family 97 N-terminal domain-containing protein, partial [Bryobacteraceae bacterium]|nr:glycoside hydrolase family 97 N-terminal domain-containing protein [Bryobacteraceae bacterium]
MILEIALLSALAAQVPASPPPVLKSPDGRLVLTFETVDKGQLAYSVTYKDRPLIERSSMTLHLQGQPPLGAEVKIVGATPSLIDETYRLVTGKSSVVRNHFNALKLDLEEDGPTPRKLGVEARAYDDAIAFRYVVPDQAALREFRLTSEATEFHLSKDATTYALLLPNFRTSYESEYVKLNASAFSGRTG